MNKFTFALALGAGLVLSLATPTVHAAAIVQSLTPGTMTSAQFNSLFTPTTGVLTDNYTMMNTPTTGLVESQVFQGTGAMAGLTAYAYQFDVNNVSDNSGQPTSVNSASMTFNATPLPVTLGSASGSASGSAMPSAIYNVTDGAVGGISASAAAAGYSIQTPSSIAWQPGTTTGSLTFQYLNATSNTGPLEAGAKSGTIVVITNEASTTMPFVSIQNANPQTGYPQAYAPNGGTIAEVPAPEPATLVGWAGVISAIALAHRVRRRRQAA
jgi:hypothetical protein